MPENMAPRTKNPGFIVLEIIRKPTGGPTIKTSSYNQSPTVQSSECY